MYDPLGLSIGTTNLAAVRSGHPPVTRRAVLTLFPDRAPELGVPVDNPDAADTGTLMAGFVERIGGSKGLMSADGSTHDPALLLVEALDALISATGGKVSTSNITMAVPAYWGAEAMRGLQEALSTHAGFVRSGVAPRLVSDSVAALTALNSDSRLPGNGVIALFDFGGSGTSITLADAAAGFTPIAETLRYSEFSGDIVDQALMVHALDNVGHTDGADPASTAVVGQFASLREDCRLAKERLSTEKATGLVVELPGQRASVEVSRAELDGLIEDRLDGLFSAFDDLLRRNRIRMKDLAGVAMAGGVAKIPLVAQRLSVHTKATVVTAVRPGLAVAAGAVMISARQPIEEQKEEELEESTMAALAGVATGSFATAAGSFATSGTFAAPTGSLGTPTGTFGVPTGGAFFNENPSETMHQLAWSEADDSTSEPIVYTGEPYDDDDNRATPSQLLQLPKFEPFDVQQRGNRLPQLFLGLAALVSMVAIGGVAFSLTSSTDRVPTLPSSTTAVPPPPPLSSQLPSPSPLPSPPPTSEAPPPPPPSPEPSVAPPPPTSEAPPPPPPPPVTQTYEPPPTTRARATTTTPQPATTTPEATTTPSTTPPPPPPTSTTPSEVMTTTYLKLPFVPVPIPIQVPQGQGGATQQPDSPYQPQNPYQQQSPYMPQNPYQPQSPYMPQNPYMNPGYGY